MLRAESKQGVVTFAKTASALTVGAMLACSGAGALAEELPGKHSTSQTRAGGSKWAELEQTFWMCDHAAAKGMIDVNHGAVCGAVTDELRREKFDGDFEKLLAWWRLNKAREHHKLDQAHIAQLDRHSASIAS